MPYATQDKMQEVAGGADRFLALTDFDGDGAIDAIVVASAMAAADSWVDGYIPQRYVPESFTPSAELVELASREAVYRIKTDRTMVSQVDIDDHKSREMYLREIRSGRVRPDVITTDKTRSVRPAIVRLGGRRDGFFGAFGEWFRRPWRDG